MVETRRTSRTAPRPEPGFARAAAWSVHLLTACGAVVALLTLLAIRDRDWRVALGWMALAVLIDAVDGALARRLRVAAVLPEVDGALLDNLVDFLNYAVVPAYLIHELHVLPGSLSLVAAAMVCTASAFQFSHVRAKRDGGLFRGFPSYWNLVAFYFLLLRPAAGVAATAVLALCVLTFVPVYYVHPTRAHRFRAPTLFLTAGYALTILIAIAQYPDTSPWLVRGSLLYVVYYASVSFKLTADLRRDETRPGQRGDARS